jgi:hypothetical protein
MAVVMDDEDVVINGLTSRMMEFTKMGYGQLGAAVVTEMLQWKSKRRGCKIEF